MMDIRLACRKHSVFSLLLLDETYKNGVIIMLPGSINSQRL